MESLELVPTSIQSVELRKSWGSPESVICPIAACQQSQMSAGPSVLVREDMQESIFIGLSHQ